MAFPLIFTGRFDVVAVNSFRTKIAIISSLLLSFLLRSRSNMTETTL